MKGIKGKIFIWWFWDVISLIHWDELDWFFFFHFARGGWCLDANIGTWEHQSDPEGEHREGWGPEIPFEGNCSPWAPAFHWRFVAGLLRRGDTRRDAAVFGWGFLFLSKLLCPRGILMLTVFQFFFLFKSKHTPWPRLTCMTVAFCPQRTRLGNLTASVLWTSPRKL